MTPITNLAERRRRETLKASAHDPNKRGFNAVFRRGETNFCPGCGRSHWHVGRTLVECAFCGCAMPFAETFL